MNGLSPRMAEAVSWYIFAPIEPAHVITMGSRLVHDLGVAGDDWDEFEAVLDEAYGTRFVVPRGFIPPEISNDSYRVAAAHGWLARRYPRVREWHRSRIRCPELTLEQLERMIVGG